MFTLFMLYKNCVRCHSHATITLRFIYTFNDVRLGLGWGLQLGFSLGFSVNSQSERVWTRLEES